VDEVDHQQCREQRALAQRIVAEKRDPGGNPDGAECGQGFLPIGGNESRGAAARRRAAVGREPYTGLLKISSSGPGLSSAFSGAFADCIAFPLHRQTPRRWP
jgi:hypothetical protein